LDSHGREQQSSPPNGGDRALLESLCCVMASDGKVSRREKAAIVEALADAKAPLTSEEIEDSITDFVSRVRTVGFRHVLNDAVEGLADCAASFNNKKMFLQSLSNVAKADGKVTERERRVVDVFWTALTQQQLTSMPSPQRSEPSKEQPAEESPAKQQGGRPRFKLVIGGVVGGVALAMLLLAVALLAMSPTDLIALLGKGIFCIVIIGGCVSIVVLRIAFMTRCPICNKFWSLKPVIIIESDGKRTLETRRVGFLTGKEIRKECRHCGHSVWKHDSEGGGV
jgi:uncharacterized tellurite resistance protein B-like protein